MKNGAQSFLLHKDKNRFRELVDRAATSAGFYAPLMEKDYYLTFILSRINELSPDLVFKGGTCLNKIYFSYYRLSEDLDFSMLIPEPVSSRSNRRKAIQAVKVNIAAFAAGLGFSLEETENAGRNESRQYIYYFIYDAVTVPTAQSIKLEISLRSNPLLDCEKRKIQHLYIHPFTNKLLFDAGLVNCLALGEIVSEKMRAAALRKDIAPRDFYDLDFILRNKFNISDHRVSDLFLKKIKEDGGDTDLKKYLVNMGRTNAEIKDMRSRIKAELFDVLTEKERQNFNLEKALKRINEAMGKIVF
ncbi:MAG TPA: nucleotidyl transferase AbiEii/AbiGii toxin family protein [Deltaproteobacteria bacterium]|nr:nucleotidyl transferase AbiEii/AbiGii toxin family protein [Deltaproteobacteria bacterium]